ncbi:cytochrome P450 [Spongiactinospora sp. 9N601]|uniref:cytochrome P450 n=1 Tax=Spongiactinospora sp. 9N601 TaxID=3375149 RepID=UPI0037AF0EF3
MTFTTELDSADPHAYFHRMREREPVDRRVDASGRAFWYLTRYADVRRALQAPELGRQLDRLPAELAEAHRRWEHDTLPMFRRNVFNLDPPDHTRLRRLLAPAFSARSMAALSRRVDECVDELVTAMTGECDLIKALALPLPILIMAELIGFPAEDRGRLRAWSDAMLSEDVPAARRAGMEFLGHVNRRIEDRRADPGDDLLSQLTGSTELSRAELVSSVFQMLFAGDETTVGLIGIAMLELLRHPVQLARLRADPGLLDSAIEEVLRFNGPVGHARPLYALSDIRFGDKVIPRGDVVVPLLLAAGRDPGAFPDPDVFDIGRSPNRHLGLGHGAHFCLGAALARMQARAALGALLARFDRITLAVAPEAVEWAPGLLVRGLRGLPLRLSTRGALSMPGAGAGAE